MNILGIKNVKGDIKKKKAKNIFTVLLRKDSKTVQKRLVNTFCLWKSPVYPSYKSEKYGKR